MIKINNKTIEIGSVFQLCYSWQCKLSKYLNIDKKTIPSNLKVVEHLGNSYLCQAIENEKFQIWATSSVIYYLQGHDVENSNVGLYFTDYFPLENSKLLILNSKNKTILPAQLLLDIGKFNNIPHLSFIFRNLLTDEKYDVTSQINNSWKDIYESSIYMTDAEKMYQDTFIHKEFVLKVCSKFAKYLEEQGLCEEAAALTKRAIVHDNSKILNKDEFNALTKIINDKDCLGDAKSQLSDFKRECIALHWKNNAHHPEHYSRYEDMTKLDKMEMVCDWMARSLQYKNNLVEFVETRQAQRFHFPEPMYDEILHYCKILASLFNQ